MTKTAEYDFAARDDGRGDVMWTDRQIATVPAVELAERIACALNSHAALVEALEALYALHEPEGRFQPSHFKPVLAQVRAALTLAKGA